MKHKVLSTSLTAILLPLLVMVLAACGATQSASPPPNSTPSSGKQGHFNAVHTPEPAAVTHAVQANTAYEQGDYRQAVAEFDASIQIDPNYEEAFVRQGISYAQLGDLDSALGDLTQAITLDPSDDAAYYNRGLVYEEMFESRNRLGYAIADFTAAIALKRDEPSYYDARGVANARQREYYTAIADFDKAIALKPDFVSAYRDRALTYGYLFDHDKALKDFTRVIELQPGTASNYYDRALAYEGLKDYAKERTDPKKALVLSQDPELTKDIQDRLATIQGR